jgi:hypothetical protein
MTTNITVQDLIRNVIAAATKRAKWGDNDPHSTIFYTAELDEAVKCLEERIAPTTEDHCSFCGSADIGIRYWSDISSQIHVIVSAQCKNCGARGPSVEYMDIGGDCGLLHVAKARMLFRQRVKEIKEEELRAEVEQLRGAMTADNQRLRKAEIRIWGENTRHGCDAPERMAEEVVTLRDEVARLKATLDGDPSQLATPEQRYAWRLSAVRYADKLERENKVLQKELIDLQEAKLGWPPPPEPTAEPPDKEPE